MAGASPRSHSPPSRTAVAFVPAPRLSPGSSGTHARTGRALHVTTDKNYIVNTQTGNAQIVEDFPKVAPGGRYRYLPGGRIVDSREGRETRIEQDHSQAVWLADDRLLIQREGRNGAASFTVLDPQGRTIHTVEPASSETWGRIDGLVPVPGSGDAAMLLVDASNSTVRPRYQLLHLNVANGDTKELATGQFVAFAPDGSRFVTAPGRELAPYGPRKRVWVAPLRLVPASGRSRTVTPGTVWVTAADWRL
jgi:hypothetical protein